MRCPQIVAAVCAKTFSHHSAAKEPGAQTKGEPGHGKNRSDDRDRPERHADDDEMTVGVSIAALPPVKANVLKCGVNIPGVKVEDGDVIDRCEGYIWLVFERLKLARMVGPIGEEEVEHEVTLSGVNDARAAGVAPREMVGELVAANPEDKGGEEQEQGEDVQ